MDTYVKGFSFMPATNLIKNDNLNYIECGELEQTWQTERRERIKQRDERIWEEFVQERDVVNIICNDDPYTFLEQLPESCLKELMEKEFVKAKQDIEEEMHVEVIEEEIHYTPEDHSNQSTAALPVNSDNENNDYQIFDDKEDDASVDVNESMESPPCTVREVTDEMDLVSLPSRPTSGKSSENVSNVIENSIYCAKIKELRNKINEDLMNMISYLEQTLIINVDAKDVTKLSKRSAEFCTRFNRVHMYQLKRQVHDAQRHSGGSAGAGPRHTMARAQLARLLSLHQSSLQAVQVLVKCVTCSGWWSEAGALNDIVAVLRDSAAAELYAGTKLTFDESQDLEAICDKLMVAVGEYTARVMKYVNNTNAFQCSSRTKKTNKVNSNKNKCNNSKNKTSAVDTRLSMYSLDTSRKPQSSHKNSLGGTSKSRINATLSDSEKKTPKETPAKHEKPQRERRARGRLPTTELHTLVEAVAPSTTSHLSHDASPRTSPMLKYEDTVPPLQITLKSPKTPKSNHNTPRQGTPSKNKSNEVNDSPTLNSRRYTQHAAETRELSKDGEVGRDQDSKVEEPKRHAGKRVSDGASNDVSKLLRQLCGGDGLSFRDDHAESPKNVQLVCVKSNSHQPSTPQLLQILEETIKKKSPKHPKFNLPVNDPESYRMTLNISDEVTEKLFQYRTKFVQHMLTSSLYANSAVGKPWEMIGSVSEQIIKELLLNCVDEMEVRNFTEILYKSELC